MVMMMMTMVTPGAAVGVVLLRRGIAGTAAARGVDVLASLMAVPLVALVAFAAAALTGTAILATDLVGAHARGDLADQGRDTPADGGRNLHRNQNRHRRQHLAAARVHFADVLTRDRRIVEAAEVRTPEILLAKTLYKYILDFSRVAVGKIMHSQKINCKVLRNFRIL